MCRGATIYCLKPKYHSCSKKPYQGLWCERPLFCLIWPIIWHFITSNKLDDFVFWRTHTLSFMPNWLYNALIYSGGSLLVLVITWLWGWYDLGYITWVVLYQFWNQLERQRVSFQNWWKITRVIYPKSHKQPSYSWLITSLKIKAFIIFLLQSYLQKILDLKLLPLANHFQNVYKI